MLETVLGIILIVMAVFLIIAVLMQHGKAHNLSGTIAGGAETFFGKSKGRTIDKTLSRVTTIVSIVFVVVVLVAYIAQDDYDIYASGVGGIGSEYYNSSVVTTATTAPETEPADTSAASSDAAVTDAADVTTPSTEVVTNEDGDVVIDFSELTGAAE